MKVFALLLSVLLLASCTGLHVYWDRSGEVAPAENSLLSAEEEVNEPIEEEETANHFVPLYDFSWVENFDWEAYRASNPNLAKVEVVEDLDEEKTEEPPVQENKALGLNGDQMVTIAICIVICLIIFTVSYNNGYRRKHHRYDDDD